MWQPCRGHNDMSTHLASEAPARYNKQDSSMVAMHTSVSFIVLGDTLNIRHYVDIQWCVKPQTRLERLPPTKIINNSNAHLRGNRVGCGPPGPGSNAKAPRRNARRPATNVSSMAYARRGKTTTQTSLL